MQKPQLDIRRSALAIASVCRALPTPGDPSGGLFVMRRLVAMAQYLSQTILQPIPYFPLLRPLPDWAAAESHEVLGNEVQHRPMFYLPKILKSKDGYWLYRSVYDRLQDLHRRGKLDLIDAHFAYPDGAGCTRAARELGVPAVVTLRGVEEDYMRIPVIAKQIRETLQSVQGCICVSHTLRDLALAAGSRPGATVVIHNAVNRAVFRPRPLTKARLQLGIDEKQPLVVSVGNLLSVKRHTVLIGAVAKLLERLPDARLVIIGGAMHEPNYPRELRDLCASLGISEHVTFAGKLPEAEVVQWLNAADTFALASRREGCCNAIIEALACGVPVVATPVGDNPHFIRDGENGFLVAVDDVEAMTAALAKSLECTDWDRGRISSELAVGNWDSVAEKVVEFMRGCVREYPASKLRHH